MRDIYIWFSIVYFIAGGMHLYLMIKIIKEIDGLKNNKKNKRL